MYRLTFNCVNCYLNSQLVFRRSAEYCITNVAFEVLEMYNAFLKVTNCTHLSMVNYKGNLTHIWGFNKLSVRHSHSISHLRTSHCTGQKGLMICQLRIFHFQDIKYSNSNIEQITLQYFGRRPEIWNPLFTHNNGNHIWDNDEQRIQIHNLTIRAVQTLPKGQNTSSQFYPFKCIKTLSVYTNNPKTEEFPKFQWNTLSRLNSDRYTDAHHCDKKKYPWRRYL